MGDDSGQSDGNVAVATWVGLRETSTPGRGNCCGPDAERKGN